VLFADEPTGALDQTTGHMIVDYLRTIANHGTTVIVITHDNGLAERFDRKISVLDGQIVGDWRKRRKARPLASVSGLSPVSRVNPTRPVGPSPRARAEVAA
jgi:ABC-type lipoprotein export system ATPase subunit